MSVLIVSESLVGSKGESDTRCVFGVRVPESEPNIGGFFEASAAGFVETKQKLPTQIQPDRCDIFLSPCKTLI